MKSRISKIGIAVAVASSLALTGCSSGSGGEGSGGNEEPLRSLSVKFDFTPILGFMLPVVVALEQGYYEEAGFDVSLSEGESANSTISAVDGGHYDIGYADAAATALAVSKGAKVKVFSVYMPMTQGSVIYRTSENISTPQDLVGKTIAATDGSSSGAMLDAMLQANGIPKDQVAIQSVASAAKVASLLQGKVDAITGFLTSECIQAKEEAAEPVECMPVGDFGVSALGVGLLSSDKLVNEEPETLKKFVEATNRGWDYALKDPEAAAEIGVKQFPLADKDLLQKQFESVEPLLHTPATKDKPYGYMAESDWEETIKFLENYRGLTNPGQPSEYYANVIE
jgi:NitT/TauT family transport system substrate-binding protein